MTASVPLPPRDSTETFLKFNKLTEHLAQSPIQNQHCLRIIIITPFAPGNFAE